MSQAETIIYDVQYFGKIERIHNMKTIFTQNSNFLISPRAILSKNSFIDLFSFTKGSSTSDHF